ncbi:MAG: hypothetical protein WBE47_07600 [Candidatus Acidiferrales bacterium]
MKAKMLRRMHGWLLMGGVAVFILLAGAPALRAQSPEPPAYQPEKGFDLYEEFRGSASDQGQFLILDSDIGYDFNRYVAVDVGIPVYFNHLTPPLQGQPAGWQDQLGDPYWDVRLSFNNHILDYDTAVTVSVPYYETGSFSGGDLGVDWFNHFDKPVGRATPFLNVGIANGVLNTQLLSQPYRLFDTFRTLGFIADGEAGMDFRLYHGFGVGGSFYEIVPSGTQKAFINGQTLVNTLLFPTAANALAESTNDHGYSAWMRLTPTRFLYSEIGYVHSIEFDANAVTLTVGFDLRSMFRHSRPGWE